MKRFEGYFCKVIAIMLIYLALAVVGSIIAFLLRHWILLFVLAAVGYTAYRYLRHGELPWLLEKLIGLLSGLASTHRKGGRK